MTDKIYIPRYLKDDCIRETHRPLDKGVASLCRVTSSGMACIVICPNTPKMPAPIKIGWDDNGDIERIIELSDTGDGGYDALLRSGAIGSDVWRTIVEDIEYGSNYIVVEE